MAGKAIGGDGDPYGGRVRWECTVTDDSLQSYRTINGENIAMRTGPIRSELKLFDLNRTEAEEAIKLINRMREREDTVVSGSSEAWSDTYPEPPLKTDDFVGFRAGPKPKTEPKAEPKPKRPGPGGRFSGLDIG